MVAGLSAACASTIAQTPAASRSGEIDKAWEQPLGAAPAGLVAGLDHAIVFASTDGVRAYDAREGQPAWALALPAVLAPATAGDQVFVAAGVQLHAIQERGGTARWIRDLGAPAVALVAHADRVIAATARTLRAWSADGTPLWERAFAADIQPGRLVADLGAVYLVLADHTLVMSDAATGAPRWTRRLASAPRALAAAAGRLYFGGADRALYAYDERGSQAWRFPRVDVLGAPAADAESVYAALWDNTVLAFAASNGHRRWRSDLPARPARGPMLAGESLLAPLATAVVLALPTETGLATAPPAPAATRSRDRLVAAALSQDGSQVFALVLLEGGSWRLVAYRRTP